jgi:hypothetical protein
MFRWSRFASQPVLTGLSLACFLALVPAKAQQSFVQGIYTCTDAKGRKLTSDRPIPECHDREQNVLNPSGTLKTKLAPSLTAQERAALEAKEKAALEEQARIFEEKRRERALLTRYPNKTVHTRERADALAQIAVVRHAAVNRVEELMRQRTILTDEMEFYIKDPSKAPPTLRRQVEEVNNNLAVQGRFIADQDSELRRVNARFDEELIRLQQLWALQAQTPIAPAPKVAASKAR